MTTIPLSFESQDSIPEGLREHARQEGGKFIVAVAPKAVVDEFREKNVNLSRERDGLVSRVQTYSTVIGEDFDAFKTRYESLTELDKKIKDKELIDNSSFEEALAQRTNSMRGEHENQVKALAAKAEAAEKARQDIANKFKRTIVDRGITNAALARDSGVRTDALNDVLARAYSAWKVGDDDVARAYDEKGNLLYGSDGATPMSPAEWLGKLKDSAPYFFLDSTGGGAGAGGGGGGPSEFAHIRSKADFKNFAEKQAYREKHGDEAYLQLPAQRT